jgi:hypothetical protein
MEAVSLPNNGIVLSEIDSNLMKIIGEEVEKIQKDFSKAVPNNKTLVGNIVHEYQIFDCKDALEKKLKDMAMLHQSTYGSNYNVGIGVHNTMIDKSKKMNLKLGNTWVNFQQKGEFNPIHNHTGMYSFVLWYKVPYFMNIEEASGPGRKGNSNRAGKFEFSYTNILGDITGSILNVDKTWEGRIALFPAVLNHQVFPFYSSNDYRISLSGNLFLVSE